MSGARRILCALVVAVCLAAVLGGKVPRDAPAASDPFQDLLARAQETISKVSTNVTNLLGLDNVPDKESVVQVLNNQSQILGAKIQQFIGKLNKEAQAHSPDFTGLLEAISARLNETVANLQASTPGVQKSASEIQDQITDGLNTVVREAGKVAKAIGGEASAVQEDLDKLTRTAVEQAVNLGKQVEERVKTVIAEHETTHV